MKFGEKTLLRRLKAGDSKACTVLIDMHYKHVYWYLLDLCKDEDLASDLTQNTFTKAWKALGDFRGESSFRTWLFSIARNEFLQQIRKDERYPELVEFLDLEVISDLSPSVEEEIASHDQELYIRKQVKALPGKYREIISLHYFSGMSYREIAKVLSIPNGTVKSRVNQALQLLKKKFRIEETGYENQRTEKIA